MDKKLLVLLYILISPISVVADDLTTDLMLLNNYNMRQDQDIWTRMRQGFRLNHPQSKLVEYYEKLYTKNPRTFATIVNNAKPYIYYILTETERNGMPSEIALLPGVESTFNSNAKSSSNAYGIWQFVPSTGRRFNLAQNSEIDERQDLVKSTKSALAYLNYLHGIFGQWEPAIGAYNWGEGNMYKEVVHAGQTPGNIDYYNLNLREETQNYLPKLIALASIIENPGKFGVNLGEIDNKPFFAIVNPLVPTSISDLTTQAQIDKATFTKLNPQYKTSDYTFSTKDSILLPVQNQSIYYASIGRPMVATYPTSNVATVDVANEASNDPIGELANNEPITTDALVPVKPATIAETTSNIASAPVTNNVNDKLDDLITTLDAKSVAPASNDVINYTVTSGDTLYSIAKRFKANINDIRQQNKIPGNDLTVGQTIVIKPNVAQISS